GGVAEGRRVIARAVAHPDQVHSGQFRLRHRDGSWRSLEINGHNRLVDPAVAGLVITGRDVTERKRMQEHLILADRMVSMGMLAAGVAHEINNPLSYVIANLAFIADQLQSLMQANPPGQLAELLEPLQAAQEGADRVG